MHNLRRFYIDGAWVAPSGSRTLDVVNPATEEPCAVVALAEQRDVDHAVAAARRAFPSYAQTTPAERIVLLDRIVQAYMARWPDLAAAISEEMGAPTTLASGPQAGSGVAHFQTAAAILKEFRFEETKDSYDIVREPIGVCALITPWNWPANQIACKVAPALAAGCTMVLKPSEVAPISAEIIAEILDAAGAPKGVFNLVYGLGPETGAALAAHPSVDMVSFTGSTRAGVEVAKAAAPSVKRVAQELGGKSPHIVLDDADIEAVVQRGVAAVMMNSGQSCNAPTRLLVPQEKLDKALAIAKAAAEAVRPGSPSDASTTIGPVASEAQWTKVQRLIKQGIAEGAPLVAGGPGRPEGLERGYYVRPTVFGPVSNDMTIAREEIFGPVLAVIPYSDEEDAVAIANDSPYGLSAYVSSGDLSRARRVGARLRAGSVHLNGAGVNFAAPFGGYKQSGNGREWGAHGIAEFLETKAILKPQ
jgi:aldehyde dehydrogenase (NAD+)